MRPQKPTTVTDWIVRFSIVVIGIYVLYAFYNPQNGLIRYWKLQRIRNEEKKELFLLQQGKRELEEAVQRLESDTLYIEEKARELGMIKKGETGYRILDNTGGKEKDQREGKTAD